MILDIVTYPDPRLKLVAKEITEITPELRQLAQDMLETMYDAPGVGLAAPQVGQSIRMLVMDPEASEQKREGGRVIINPVLELQGEQIRSEAEGCLSVPYGFRADVKRFARVHLTGMDLDGNPLNELLEGFPAIVLQHEYDHLNGTLFIDRIGRLRRTMYDAKVRKMHKRGQVENNA